MISALIPAAAHGVPDRHQRAATSQATIRRSSSAFAVHDFTLHVEFAARGGAREPRDQNAPKFRAEVQGGSVFAEFDLDADGCVFAVRVSYDGHGCCRAPTHIGRMNACDSEALLAMVNRGSIDPSAAQILRSYFQQNQDAL